MFPMCGLCRWGARVRDAGLADLELPGFGFELIQADHEPLAADEGLLVSADGVEGLVVAFGEGVELGGVFAEDDEGFGVKAEFGRVAGGCALAFGRGGRSIWRRWQGWIAAASGLT